jgi:uncharacterized membrane protein YraQ (UPF0718 family)/YHS domain-containing protein
VSALLANVVIVTDIGRGVREGLFMLWETLWALVFGFTLSGAVQAFVSKATMQAALGTRRPAAIARASGYGMASSSCSYAASAMAKSLFAKGADFTTSMVFMIASTNLVVELGVVMLILLGWQFTVAEFVGGPIIITIVAVSGGYVFSRALTTRARGRLQLADVGHAHHVVVDASDTHEPLAPSISNYRTRAGWSDASSYAVSDVTMIRKELAIGFLVAGFLAVLVPGHFWNDLFLHGHGFWTVVENSLVGPLIAVISWVCSIGNVPLAAALWSGGISFGGVIAFIFADLIAMPLLLIYRKFYGTRLTLRMVALLYAAMAIAGLATQGIFSAAHLIPTHRTIAVGVDHFSWNYTTYLDILALGVGFAVWWLAHTKSRHGGGEGYAIDPVCAMQVRTADAPAATIIDGVTYYFCCDRCRERFVAEPERFLGDADSPRRNSTT